MAESRGVLSGLSWLTVGIGGYKHVHSTSYKEPGLVREYLSALKAKVCPLIELTE